MNQTDETRKRKTRRAGSCLAIIAGSKYQLRIFTGRSADGRRHYHSEVFHGPQKAAEKRLRELLTRLSQGEPLRTTSATIAEFFDEWLTSKTKIRERSREHYRGLINFYILPELGKLRLVDLQPSHIERLYANLTAKGLAGKTVKYVHTLLKTALKLAQNRDLIRVSPFRTVEAPRGRSREMKPMTADQAKQFLAAASQTREGIIFHFALLTGARPAEYLGLKWVDIDGHTVTIRRSIVFKSKGDWSLTDPKNTRSRRTITLPPALIAGLQEWRTRQLAERLKAGADWQDHGFVFTTPNGEPVSLNQARGRFSFVLKYAGLPHFRLYDLRHTFGSTLAARGVSIRTIAELMGHSNVATTLASYIHSDEAQKRDAMAILEAAVAG